MCQIIYYTLYHKKVQISVYYSKYIYKFNQKVIYFMQIKIYEIFIF